jgi:soluble lytic murein transglycosylase-like protein
MLSRMRYFSKAKPQAGTTSRLQRWLTVLPPVLGALVLTWLFTWSWPQPLPPLEHATLLAFQFQDQPARAHASWEDPLEQRQRHFWPVVRRLSHREGVDPALIMAVVQVESGFTPTARSPRGAKGLMQINRPTARHLGLTDPQDPEANLSAGIRYLAELQRAFDHDVTLALAAYNAGPTRVRQAGSSVPDIEETREFVEQVLEQAHVFRRQLPKWD